MDFLNTYLATKNQHDAIVVVVNRFSEMDILTPSYKKTMISQQTTQIFFERVWKKYGLPYSIINNHESIYVIIFWKTL